MSRIFQQYFALSIILLIVTGCSNKPLNRDNSILSVMINGCAANVKEGSKGLVIGGPRDPEINVIDQKIIYSRALNHLCCRVVEISKEIIGNKINIYENWSGRGCKCECFSEITATIEKVPTGTYIISVYEIGTDPFDETNHLEKRLIISKEVNIN